MLSLFYRKPPVKSRRTRGFRQFFCISAMGLSYYISIFTKLHNSNFYKFLLFLMFLNKNYLYIPKFQRVLPKNFVQNNMKSFFTIQNFGFIYNLSFFLSFIPIRTQFPLYKVIPQTKFTDKQKRTAARQSLCKA